MAIRIRGTFRRAVIRWTTPKRQFVLTETPLEATLGNFQLGTVNVSLRALHTLTPPDIAWALHTHVHCNANGQDLCSLNTSRAGDRFMVWTNSDCSSTELFLFEERLQ